jgi:putative transcriptional regulator
MANVQDGRRADHQRSAQIKSSSSRHPPTNLGNLFLRDNQQGVCNVTNRIQHFYSGDQQPNKSNRLSGSLPSTPSMQGELLVASELLESTPFARTVVYVLQDDPAGTFGVVLNRPADKQLRAAWIAASGLELAEDDCHLLSGGPLGGPVFALHSQQQLGEIAVNNGIFLSATAESIGQLVNQHEEPYRIYLGVVGWKKGLLRAELERHVWYHFPASPGIVFDQSGLLWEKSLLSFGRHALRDILSLGDLPPDPERN